MAWSQSVVNRKRRRASARALSRKGRCARPVEWTRLQGELLETRHLLAVVPFASVADQLHGQLGIVELALKTGMNALSSGDTSTLPFVGDKLGEATSTVSRFTQQLHDSLDSLGNRTDPAPGVIKDALLQGLSGFIVDRSGNGQVGHEDILITPDLSALTGDFTLQMRVKAAATSTSLPFDLGLRGLPFEIQSNGDIEISSGFEYEFSFQYFAASQQSLLNDQPSLAGIEHQMAIFVEASLANFNAQGTVGFVQGTLTPISNQPNALNLTLYADQLTTTPTLGVNGTADINLKLAGGFGFLPETFPRINTDLHVHWGFGVNNPSNLAPLVSFDNVGLDLGAFLSELLSPFIDAVQTITAPFDPLNRLLDTPLPGLSDLSRMLGLSDITLMTLAQVAATATGFGPLGDLLAELVKIQNTINDLQLDSGNIFWPLGGFSLTGGDNNWDPRNFPLAASIANLDFPNLTSLELDMSNLNAVAVQLLNQFNGFVQGTSLPPEVKNMVSRLARNQNNGYEFRFPILDNPAGGVFNLLLGREAELFYFDANLNVFSAGSVATNLTFLGAPLDVSGEIEVNAHLKYGYDTFGLRRLVNNLIAGDFSHVASDVLDGFYFASTHEIDPANPHTFFKIGGEISIGKGLFPPLSIAHLEVGGYASTLEESGGRPISVSLNDPNNDGKLRFAEFSGDLFEFEGKFVAGLGIRVGIGFNTPLGFVGIRKRFSIADVVLWDSEWALSGPPPVKLAEFLASGILVLSIGERAHLREGVDTTNGNEEYSITHLGGTLGNETIRIDAFGRSQVIAGVERILGTGDAGNITITVHPGVTSNVVFVGGQGSADFSYAGLGDANLTAGQGNSDLTGGEGINLLVGGPSNDTLTSGGGDTFFGNDGGHDSFILVFPLAKGAVIGTLGTPLGVNDLLILAGDHTSAIRLENGNGIFAEEIWVDVADWEQHPENSSQLRTLRTIKGVQHVAVIASRKVDTHIAIDDLSRAGVQTAVIVSAKDEVNHGASSSEFEVNLSHTGEPAEVRLRSVDQQYVASDGQVVVGRALVVENATTSMTTRVFNTKTNETTALLQHGGSIFLDEVSDIAGTIRVEKRGAHTSEVLIDDNLDAAVAHYGVETAQRASRFIGVVSHAAHWKLEVTEYLPTDRVWIDLPGGRVDAILGSRATGKVEVDTRARLSGIHADAPLVVDAWVPAGDISLVPMDLHDSLINDHFRLQGSLPQDSLGVRTDTHALVTHRLQGNVATSFGSFPFGRFYALSDLPADAFYAWLSFDFPVITAKVEQAIFTTNVPEHVMPVIRDFELEFAEWWDGNPPLPTGEVGHVRVNLFPLDSNPQATDSHVYLDASQLRGSFSFTVAEPPHDIITALLGASVIEGTNAVATFGQTFIDLVRVHPELDVAVTGTDPLRNDFWFNLDGPLGSLERNVLNVPGTRLNLGHDGTLAGIEGDVVADNLWLNQIDNRDAANGSILTLTDGTLNGWATHSGAQPVLTFSRLQGEFRLATGAADRVNVENTPRGAIRTTIENFATDGPAMSVYVVSKNMMPLYVTGNFELHVGHRLNPDGTVTPLGTVNISPNQPFQLTGSMVDATYFQANLEMVHYLTEVVPNYQYIFYVPTPASSPPLPIYFDYTGPAESKLVFDVSNEEQQLPGNLPLQGIAENSLYPGRSELRHRNYVSVIYGSQVEVFYHGPRLSGAPGVHPSRRLINNPFSSRVHYFANPNSDSSVIERVLVGIAQGPVVIHGNGERTQVELNPLYSMPAEVTIGLVFLAGFGSNSVLGASLASTILADVTVFDAALRVVADIPCLGDLPTGLPDIELTGSSLTGLTGATVHFSNLVDTNAPGLPYHRPGLSIQLPSDPGVSTVVTDTPAGAATVIGTRAATSASDLRSGAIHVRGTTGPLTLGTFYGTTEVTWPTPPGPGGFPASFSWSDGFAVREVTLGHVGSLDGLQGAVFLHYGNTASGVPIVSTTIDGRADASRANVLMHRPSYPAAPYGLFSNTSWASSNHVEIAGFAPAPIVLGNPLGSLGSAYPLEVHGSADSFYHIVRATRTMQLFTGADGTVYSQYVPLDVVGATTVTFGPLLTMDTVGGQALSNIRLDPDDPRPITLAFEGSVLSVDRADEGRFVVNSLGTGTSRVFYPGDATHLVLKSVETLIDTASGGTSVHFPGGVILNVRATSGPLWIEQTGSNSSINFAPTTHNMQSIQGPVTVVADVGSVQITFDDGANAVPRTVDFYADAASVTHIVGLAPQPLRIEGNRFNSRIISGTAGSRYQIGNTVAAPPFGTLLTLFSRPADMLVGPDLHNTWTISHPDNGEIWLNDVVRLVGGFQPASLQGGSDTDIFTITHNSYVPGLFLVNNIDGGAGIDRLAYTFASVWQQGPHDFANGLTALVGGLIGNIEQVPIAIQNPGNKSNIDGTTIVQVQVQALGGLGSLTYSAAGLPPGLAIDPQTGVISGRILQPTPHPKLYTATLFATDGGSEAQVQFTWNVVSGLSIVNPGARLSPEGVPIHLPIQVNNPAEHPLTYSATGLPDWLTINPQTGVISGEIGFYRWFFGFSPTFSVQVFATDGVHNVSTSFSWATQPGFQVSNPGNRLNQAGLAASLSLSINNLYGHSFAFGAVELPPGLSINSSSGQVSGTIDVLADAGSPYNVVITVTDLTINYSLPLAFQWTVLPAPLIFAHPGTQTTRQGMSAELAIESLYDFGLPITYAAEDLPPGLSIDPASGVISGTVLWPSSTDATYWAWISATDGVRAGFLSFEWIVQGLSDNEAVLANPVSGGAMRIEAPDGTHLFAALLDSWFENVFFPQGVWSVDVSDLQPGSAVELVFTPPSIVDGDGVVLYVWDSELGEQWHNVLLADDAEPSTPGATIRDGKIHLTVVDGSLWDMDSSTNGSVSLLVGLPQQALSVTISDASTSWPVGVPIRFRGAARGTGSSSAELTWRVLLNDEPVQSGSGTDLLFTPSQAGRYRVVFVARQGAQMADAEWTFMALPNIGDLNAGTPANTPYLAAIFGEEVYFDDLTPVVYDQQLGSPTVLYFADSNRGDLWQVDVEDMHAARVENIDPDQAALEWASGLTNVGNRWLSFWDGEMHLWGADLQGARRITNEPLYNFYEQVVAGDSLYLVLRDWDTSTFQLWRARIDAEGDTTFERSTSDNYSDLRILAQFDDGVLVAVVMPEDNPPTIMTWLGADGQVTPLGSLHDTPLSSLLSAPVVAGSNGSQTGFYFRVTPAHTELWTFNSADIGGEFAPTLVNTFTPDVGLETMYAVGEHLVFSTARYDSNGVLRQFWRSDGTPDGTFPVGEPLQLGWSTGDANLYELMPTADALYFLLQPKFQTIEQDTVVAQLGKIDPLAGEWIVLHEYSGWEHYWSRPWGLSAAGDRVYFQQYVAESEAYVFSYVSADEPTPTLVPVNENNPYADVNHYSLAYARDTLYFAASSSALGDTLQLWGLSSSVPASSTEMARLAVSGISTDAADGEMLHAVVAALLASGDAADDYAGTVSVELRTLGGDLVTSLSGDFTNGRFFFDLPAPATGGALSADYRITVTSSGKSVELPLTVRSAARLAAAGDSARVVAPSEPFSYRVEVLDARSVLAAGYDGLVSLAYLDAAGTLHDVGGGARAAVGGVVTFDDVVLPAALGTCTLVATSADGAMTARFQVVVATVTELVLTAEQDRFAPGEPFRLTVSARDFTGQLATGYADALVLSILTPWGSIERKELEYLTAADQGTIALREVNFWSSGEYTFVVSDGLRSASLTLLIAETPVLPGDVDGNGQIDAADIDLLYALVQANDPAGDLNGDGLVDQTDVDYLVRTILQTEYGDANLDGYIDAEDLKRVRTNIDRQHGGANWAAADFDGNGYTDAADLAQVRKKMGFVRPMAILTDEQVEPSLAMALDENHVDAAAPVLDEPPSSAPSFEPAEILAEPSPPQFAPPDAATNWGHLVDDALSAVASAADPPGEGSARDEPARSEWLTAPHEQLGLGTAADDLLAADASWSHLALAIQTATAPSRADERPLEKVAVLVKEPLAPPSAVLAVRQTAPEGWDVGLLEWCRGSLLSMALKCDDDTLDAVSAAVTPRSRRAERSFRQRN